MADRSIVRSLSSVLLLGGTALGLYNVYSDNAELKAQAQKVACADRPCNATITRESRSPLAQNFTYQTELTEKGKTRRGASVDVECKRAYYLLGEYSCVGQGVLPPQ
jgi:hypothetical protein